MPSLPWGLQPPFSVAAARQPPVCPSGTRMPPKRSQHLLGACTRKWVGAPGCSPSASSPLHLLFSPFLLFLLLIAPTAIAPSAGISAGGLQAQLEEQTSPGTRTPRVSAVTLRPYLAGTARWVIRASWDGNLELGPGRTCSLGMKTAQNHLQAAWSSVKDGPVPGPNPAVCQL